MPTEARKELRAFKRNLRENKNTFMKSVRADARKQADIELGKTVIVTETDGIKTYSFPPTQKIQEPQTPPRLTWLSGKTYRHSNPRKNLSGHSPEHAEANIENASRVFATEVTKALAPDVPAVDGAPVV